MEPGTCEKVPNEVRCFGGTEIEKQVLLSQNLPDLIEEMLHENSRRENSPDEVLKRAANFLNSSPVGSDGDTVLYLKKVAKAFSDNWGITLVPIYDSPEDWQKEYSTGTDHVTILNFKDVPLANEDKLYWEQVMEFRKDLQSLEKYRDFLFWLSGEIVNNPPENIIAELSLRLHDYNKALKKHGIAILKGALTEVVDQRFMLGQVRSKRCVFAEALPGIKAMERGLTIENGTSLKAGHTDLDLSEMDRGNNSEISWVYHFTEK
jgi:hypothetical protein